MLLIRCFLVVRWWYESESVLPIRTVTFLPVKNAEVNFGILCVCVCVCVCWRLSRLNHNIYLIFLSNMYAAALYDDHHSQMPLVCFRYYLHFISRNDNLLSDVCVFVCVCVCVYMYMYVYVCMCVSSQALPTTNYNREFKVDWEKKLASLLFIDSSDSIFASKLPI